MASKRAYSATTTCEALFAPEGLVSTPLSDSVLSLKGPGFVIPNEKNTNELKTHFAKVPEGAGLYITVGTERAFVAAGLLGSKITGLVAVDTDPRVNQFNLINKALIGLARDAADYRNLRFNVRFVELEKRVRYSRSLSTENRQVLSRADMWEWWTKTARDRRTWEDFYSPSSPNFGTTNYLFNEDLFANLKKLVREDRITVLHRNIVAPEFSEQLKSFATSLHTQIAIVDLSNAWQQGYAGHDRTLSFLKSLRLHFSRSAQFILTYQKKIRDDQASEFRYISVPLDNNISMPMLAALFSGLERMDPSTESYHPTHRHTRFID